MKYTEMQHVCLLCRSENEEAYHRIVDNTGVSLNALTDEMLFDFLKDLTKHN